MFHPCQSGASVPGRWMEKYCRVTALRSFSPAKPTRLVRTPAARAISPATSIVLRSRLVTHSHRCSPWPSGSCPRTSLTTKSSGRSEEHTSELQSRGHLVCRLLLEKKHITNRKH